MLFGYILNWNKLEILTGDSDSLVRVRYIIDNGILSSAGHEKPCVNQPGPSGKAKYYWETDSELVPWGKGEKDLE